MSNLNIRRNKPGLLVSVRSADEAVTALAGGADVIDVKEPDRGSLGAADMEVLEAIVRVVNKRAIVTAAVGELIELIDGNDAVRQPKIPAGVSLFKIGLARTASLTNWQDSWRRAIETYASSSGSPKPVAVAYADWQHAMSPEPREVLEAAVEFGCPALLIDTEDKSGGPLFDHWSESELKRFVREVHSRNIAIVLAGSLVGEAITDAARLMPDFVAVRTAACDSGRGGTVSLERVRAVRQAISAGMRSEQAV
jgi:uncharacterized protein (UPF0264 family)